jgi:hypothetical protein
LPPQGVVISPDGREIPSGGGIITDNGNIRTVVTTANRAAVSSTPNVAETSTSINEIINTEPVSTVPIQVSSRTFITEATADGSNGQGFWTKSSQEGVPPAPSPVIEVGKDGDEKNNDAGLQLVSPDSTTTTITSD